MEGSTTELQAVGGKASQEDDGAVASCLIVDDETASELSELLDLFAAPPPPIKVRFIDDPYSSSPTFQLSSAYVTINGNEESCGSSFSESNSSVMASIDFGGARMHGTAWRVDLAEARGLCVVDVELDGFSTDVFDYPDSAEDAAWVKLLGEISV